jgi:hypothetical protein
MSTQSRPAPRPSRRARTVDNTGPGHATAGPPRDANPAPTTTPRAPPRRDHTTHLSYATQFCAPGQDKPGYSSAYSRIKRVWKVPYGLNDDTLDLLHARFPGLAFVCDGFEAHDHPISHISLNVVWHNVLRKLPLGAKAADICGNPQVNENFMKTKAKLDRPPVIDSYCKVMCARDSLRLHSRWGPKVSGARTRWTEMSMYDMYRFVGDASSAEHNAKFASYDHFLMNHVLYYYTFAEVTQLLNMRKGSVLLATLHKLPGAKGVLNHGEQAYEKKGTRVKMWNTDTGEWYEHADPAPWFSQYTYADENGAIAWTVDKGCDDTYIITATATEPALVEGSAWLGGRQVLVNAQGERAETRTAPLPVPDYQDKVVTIRASDMIRGAMGGSRRITITHPDLYEKMLSWMANKPRNVTVLKDLTAYARRTIGASDLIGGSKKPVSIGHAALVEHIAAAFVAGHALESSLYQDVAPQFASVAASGTVMKRTFKLAISALTLLRSNDPAMHTLRLLDDCLAG